MPDVLHDVEPSAWLMFNKFQLKNSWNIEKNEESHEGKDFGWERK